MFQMKMRAITALSLAIVSASPAAALERYSVQLEKAAARLLQAVSEKDKTTIRREGLMLSRAVGALSRPSQVAPKCFAPAHALYVLTIDLQSTEANIVEAAKKRFSKFNALMPACREEDGVGEDITKPPGRGL